MVACGGGADGPMLAHWRTTTRSGLQVALNESTLMGGRMDGRFEAGERGRRWSSGVASDIPAFGTRFGPEAAPAFGPGPGDPRPGDVLAARYELHSELGRGGMGRVFEAHDRLLGRDVALKVLTTADDDDTSRQACLREARVAARISHPNVATVLDVGADHDLGVTFLVMELVPGQTLKDVRRAAGTLTPADAVELVAQVACALEATHARGVVHGDVTPRNFIVRPDGVVKLFDFGIARVLDASRPVEVRGRYGSVPYLAPEQVHGSPPDLRSDVYALGAVLYELLVGEPPYTGRDTATVMAARLVADPPPPSGRNPAVSPALEGVILTALARDPARRYASAAELREALCRVLRAATSDTRVLSRLDVAAADRASGVQEYVSRRPDDPAAPPARHRPAPTARFTPVRDAAATFVRNGGATPSAAGVAPAAQRATATTRDRSGASPLRRPWLGRGAPALAGLAIVLGVVLLATALWRGVGTTEANRENLPGTDWAALTQPTCEWSNVTTPPGICFGERPAGFRVRVVERQGPRWMIWDPTTNGVAYVDAAALRPE